MRRSIVCALWLVSLRALGADCGIDQQADANAHVTKVLGLSSVTGCFGRGNDESPLAKRILAEIEPALPPTRTTEEVLIVRDSASGWIRDIGVSFSAASANPDSDWLPVVELMRSRLAEAKLQVDTFDATVEAAYWELGDLDYFDGALDLKAPIRRSCGVATAPSCASGVALATEIVRHGELVHAVLNKVLSERRLVPIYHEVVALDEKWDYYFEKGRSQYLWELALNGALYRRKLESNELAPPPNGQWILLHPGAAVQFVRGNQSPDDTSAVAIVELVGYNRLWSQGSVLRDLPLGISAIATVSLNEQGDRLGWGAMVHIKNKFSIGAARRDVGTGKKTTWLVSVDLGALLLKVDEEVKNRVRFSSE